VGSEYSIHAGRSGGGVISASVYPCIASYVVAGVSVVGLNIRTVAQHE